MSAVVPYVATFAVGVLVGFVFGRYLRPRGGHHRGVQLRRP